MSTPQLPTVASSSSVAGPSGEGPSNLALPIPIPHTRPGKSILKTPPPPQKSFFSLSALSKLLPAPEPAPLSSLDESKGIRGTPLKRAHFVLPHLSTTYPIWSQNPPSSPAIHEAKVGVEEKERERRSRVVRGNSFTSTSDEYWGLERVELFYKECCWGREEPVNEDIVAAIKAAGTPNRTLDLSGVQLTPFSAATVADVLNVEWGVRKVIMRECNLDEMTLKPILHSLLLPNSLTYLSLASNKQLKGNAWRLVGVYIGKASTLQFLDLSQNSLDKRAVENIIGTLGVLQPASSGTSTPTTEVEKEKHASLISLKLDDCSLRPTALETLAHAIRVSPLRNISLRHNRISAPGAVALALMIKDYPDAVPTFTHTPSNSVPPSPNSSVISHSLNAPPPRINAPGLAPPSPVPRPTTHSPAARPQARPPPQQQTLQPTYTPYIPRSRRGTPRSPAVSPASSLPTSPTEERQVPLITSSLGGGVTTRHPPIQSPEAIVAAATAAAREAGPSAALLDKVRALDNLPRLGALRTLDLRGNDIRTGVTYISQVLKRNRTLKVLNLSENRIGVEGLIAIAEALKYNSSLETLDLGRNPCCGPGLEGVTSLRTAFTLNASLKRLFLSSTGLTSPGAIMLAEFLPESTSLLHLDLTENNLDLAGVMALSVGLKANEVMRCLDLNIPAGDEEMARLCRDILNTCVRNTERAEERAKEEGGHKPRAVWGMIEDSTLAKVVRADEGRRSEADIIATAKSLKVELEALLAVPIPSSSSPSPLVPPMSPKELNPGLIKRAKAHLPSLIALIQTNQDPRTLEEMLSLNDSLTSLLTQAAPPKLRIPNGHSKPTKPPIEIPPHPVNDEEEAPTPRRDKGKGKAKEPVDGVLSPNFSIVGSDDEDDGVHSAAPVAPEDHRTAPSPTDARSRNWVAEEGEIFRKGVVLLGPDEMEGEYAGEELRKELLEAEVERPPQRTFDTDADGLPLPEPDPPKSPSLNLAARPGLSPRPSLTRLQSSSGDNDHP